MKDISVIYILLFEQNRRQTEDEYWLGITISIALYKPARYYICQILQVSSTHKLKYNTNYISDFIITKVYCQQVCDANIYNKDEVCCIANQEIESRYRLGTDIVADISYMRRHINILIYIDSQLYILRPLHELYQHLKRVRLYGVVMIHDISEGRTFIIYINISLDFTDEMEYYIISTSQFGS